MGLFEHMNIFGDVATCHRGDKNTFMLLASQIEEAGAIVKIQLFSEQTFPREWAPLLNGLNFVSSVFRPEDVDFILPYRPLALKVASVEATHYKLIQQCIQTELPLIISTGGMNEGEIENLIDFTPEVKELCLMHCVSIYPTPKEQINLGRLAKLSEELSILQEDEAYDIAIGWSSHYPVVDQAAYALAWAWGATQFEVHVREQRPFCGSISGIINFEDTTDLTLDERCAFTPYGLKQIRSILEDLPVLEGSDDYAGPDREAVLEWRKRWQT